jgi:hypothetical protein
MTSQEKFDKAITYINREGIQNLVTYLKEETDFFTAPSSTIYHCNYTSGLLEHSINVLEVALHNFNFLINRKPDLLYLKESVIICALFHDVCKTNQFVLSEKWIKDKHNQWKSYKGYEVEDKFPLGHGEKSVYIISKFIRLTDAEALAVRFHQGSFEIGTTIPGLLKYSYGQAYEHPLVKLIHGADVMAGTFEDIIDYKSQVM